MSDSTDPLLVEYVAAHSGGGPITLVAGGALVTGCLAEATEHTYAPTVSSLAHELDVQSLADLERAFAALGADADRYLDRSMLENARARVGAHRSQDARGPVTHIALVSALVCTGGGAWIAVTPGDGLFRVRADGITAWSPTPVADAKLPHEG
ncbi:hypothetical protein Cfla_2045 [Cellulomonas flavigena DSM 20109]|uniref:Uncharacterized protein n=1 Tax=Cellulomonas flavigena (strain ATCC 482 / DSM 20109 / BCRC 11376 / JCM 18109 / NBRC 3775 / NCIMB 8073 / NRS 134) TaxID=446466 RepID=D5UFE3_CELFN|nr:hypothetical protein [Cellulomonas flavigena]ADG74940.1 hypothetical protein Cfla_2045 [Cellulomonas flavigena DSM 20109]